MKYNWNPTTADEPDDSAGLREDAISNRAERLMSDEGWIEAALADGIDSRALAKVLAAMYVPGTTHALVGGLLMDALWDLAVAQATATVDDGE